MDVERALKILDLHTISLNIELTPQIIKQQYHKLALLHHPDKNPSSYSSENFKEICDAYTHLKNNYLHGDHKFDEDKLNDCDEWSDPQFSEHKEEYVQYKMFLNMFLNNLYDQIPSQNIPIHKNRYLKIMSTIVTSCEKQISIILNDVKSNMDLLRNILEVVTKYKDILHISVGVLDKIQIFIEKYLKNDDAQINKQNEEKCEYFCNEKTIIVKSRLKDLLDGNVYVYNLNSLQIDESSPPNNIYVPLWAMNTDLFYEINEDVEIIFQSIPEDFTHFYEKKSGDGIINEIRLDDTTNDLYVSFFAEIKDIWDKNEFVMKIDGKDFFIDTNTLKLKKKQDVILPGCGIPTYNENDVFDVTQRADIHVSLHICV